MAKILIGTDPELFVFDKMKQDYVSAHNLMPGTKQNPFLVKQGAIQVDGVAAEFNTFPADNVSEFLDNHTVVMDQLLEIINKNDPGRYELHCVPTVKFDKEYWETLPESAKLLGCAPDYSAYTGKTKQPTSITGTTRTGGFHIHIGWTETANPSNPVHIERCCNLVKSLDAAIFRASMLWDADEKRRKLYGEIGSFRPKYYGLEYRPLSNKALENFEVMKWLYETSVRVTELFFIDKVSLEDDWNATEDWMNKFWHDEYDLPRLPESLFGKIEEVA